MPTRRGTAAQLEVCEALEKVKDETKRGNINLTSLVREVAMGRFTPNSPTQKKTGSLRIINIIFKKI